MPNRILRDGILTSEKVNALSWEEEVFYRRLMSVVDDYGRFYSLPKLLRSNCYPLHIDDVSDSDVEKWLAACIQSGLISTYIGTDGKQYIQLYNFGQQQRAKSKFPEPVANNGNQLISDASNCNQAKSNAHLDGVVFGDEDEGGSNGENPTPSQESKATDTCPHSQIVDLYHEILPSARRIRDWTPSRQTALRARWREKKERQDIGWWQRFFVYISGCDFLMGRVSNPGRKPFELSLDWVLKAENFIKIIEGAYQNKEAMA